MAYIRAYFGDAFELMVQMDFKPNVLLVALAQTASHLHAMFMHHIVAYDCVLIAGTVPSR